MLQQHQLKPWIALIILGLIMIPSIVFWDIKINFKKMFWEINSNEKSIFSRQTANNTDISNRQTKLSEITGKTSQIQDEPEVIMNDPALKQSWGLEKSQAMKAWKITQGSDKITVAVIDTGCDLTHEDLVDNYWKNPNEIANGKDDDDNGYIDDLYGWNFVNNNNDLSDNHGHGTHIAGIIGALANNKKGIVGIAPKVKIMCLKYYDPKIPSDHLQNTIQAIHYAIKMNVDIINYSGGGLEPSQKEFEAIDLARKKGVLFVAAAGNERSNSDLIKYYPADYGLDNIISVTAINPTDKILPSSNYGVQTVDIAAPGQNILSTLPGNTYGFMTGTSQATAFVTGAAVLVKARHPNFNYLEIKKYILQTGNVDENLLEKTRTSRKLNLFKALIMMDHTLTLSGLKGTKTPSFSTNDPLENFKKSDPFHDLHLFNRELKKNLTDKENQRKTNQLRTTDH